MLFHVIIFFFYLCCGPYFAFFSLRIMSRRYLLGLDTPWCDYAAVDGNSCWDDERRRVQDAEDAYFRDEE